MCKDELMSSRSINASFIMLYAFLLRPSPVNSQYAAMALSGSDTVPSVSSASRCAAVRGRPIAPVYEMATSKLIEMGAGGVVAPGKAASLKAFVNTKRVCACVHNVDVSVDM